MSDLYFALDFVINAIQAERAKLQFQFLKKTAQNYLRKTCRPY